jgi:hypothetical protein
MRIQFGFLPFFIFLFLRTAVVAQEPAFTRSDPATGILSLTQEGASHFAQLALNCIQTEYPNKTGHVNLNESDNGTPAELHPAFYGCFDWHSAVHGHWMLVRLLKLFPDLPEGPEIRSKLNQNLSRANLLQEAAYLYQSGRKSFERMYGWSWMLKLGEELHGWDDPDARQWAKNLIPVTEAIVERYMDFLPRQTYPIRVGTHTNTAFGMSFAWDYANTVGNDSLRLLLESRAKDYFDEDYDCPARWEPGGADFLSPCLEEANLMRRVLSRSEFEKWIEKFLPDLKTGGPPQIMTAAEVSDRTDPQIVHLDGVNLSRAWCLLGIAKSLPAEDPAREVLIRTARIHLQATLPSIASGNYEGEHWLASFAVYSLSHY